MSEDPGFDQNSPTVRYSLSRQAGTGGVPTLTAVDRVSGKPLSVQEIAFPPNASAEDRRARIAQAKWEADRLAQLRGDPGVPAVYGVVEDQGRLWIITEAVNGTDLARVVSASGPLSAPEAGRIATAVLGALAAAHAAGVAHRAVRPDNIVRCDDGRVLLAGFCTAPAQSYPEAALLDFADPHRVRTGQATFGGDLFSLGATLYYLLEGTAPFARPTPQAVAAAIQTEEPPAPHRAGPLTPVVLALLRKNQAEVPSPAAARDQIAAALGQGGAGSGGYNPGLSYSSGSASTSGPGAASNSSSLAGTSGSGAGVGNAIPDSAGATAGAGAGAGGFASPSAETAVGSGAVLPVYQQQPWTLSRTLWLVAALASTIAVIVGFTVSWGTIQYIGSDPFTGTQFTMIKTAAGGSTAPALAVYTWSAPIVLAVLATAILGLTSALVSRRLGWLCAAGALLVVAAEAGSYLWVADIPASSLFDQPSISLHAGGFLTLGAAPTALLAASAAQIADRRHAAAERAARPAAGPGHSVPALIRIVVAVAAAVAVVALFLPFGTRGDDVVNAPQWSQIVVPAELCCLGGVLLSALLRRAPRRPLTANHLVIPAGGAFLLQILMTLEVVGLNQEGSSDNRISLDYGCWIGIAATLIALAFALVGYRRSKAATANVGTGAGPGFAAAQPYGTPPGGVPMGTYPPVPSQGGYASGPQPGYQMPQPQRSYPPAQSTPPSQGE